MIYRFIALKAEFSTEKASVGHAFFSKAVEKAVEVVENFSLIFV